MVFKLTGRYVKANSLVNAAYRLSVAEQRVLIMALMDANPRNITDCQTYRVDARDLQKYTGTCLQSTIEVMKKAAERLQQRQIVFYERPDGAPYGEIVKTSWVQTIRYEDGRAALSLRFSKDILPYINKLTKRFTIVYLMDGPENFTLELDSNYSYRLLEMMSQWIDRGYFEITVQQLRILFALTTQYPKVAQLKIRVIDHAIKELNAKTAWKVSYEDIKKNGRTIAGFRFKFKVPNAIMERRKEEKYLTVTEEEIHRHAVAGETESQARARVYNGKKQIRKLLHEIES